LTKLEITGQCYACPSCEANLCLADGKLIITEKRKKKSDPKKDIEIEENKEEYLINDIDCFENWIKQLKIAISASKIKIPEITVDYDPNEVKEIHETASKYRTLEETSQKLEKEMESDKPPERIAKYFDEASELKEQFPKKFKPNKKGNELDEEVSELKKQIEQAWRVTSEHASYWREISTRKSQVDNIVRQFGDNLFLPTGKKRTLKRVNREYSSIQAKVLSHSHRLTELQSTFDLIANYENFTEQKEAINNLRREKGELENKLKEAEQQYQGAVGLGDAAKEAEVKALEDTIASINEHAAGYLDLFFDEKICVRLKSSKITSRKIKKTQLNTFVEYKGSVYGNINELSGGEIQRCELAFLLAVNEMVGSQILLLDECLNNLDNTVNMDVLRHLKKLGEGKMIAVVAHEAIPGVFDDIIFV